MAEPLYLVTRTGVASYFLPFLLVFAVVYAFLAKTKLAGDRSDINAVIALVVAFLSILSEGFRIFILGFIPYAAVLFLLLFLGIFMYAIFGAGEKDIEKVLKNPSFYYPLAIIFIILVFIAAAQQGLFSKAYNYTNYTNATGVPDQSGTLVGPGAATVIFGSPVVLGMIVLLVLMAIAMYYIAKPEEEKKE